MNKREQGAGSREQGMAEKRFYEILLFVAVIAAFPVCVKADVILPDAGKSTLSMFSDVKALKIDDLVTILIVESATATNTADTKTSKKFTSKGGPGTGYLDFLQAWGISQDESFQGGGATTRTGKFTAKLTARIVDILPGGNYKIEGTQLLTINNEKQVITLTGIVRPQDISGNNTVLSNFVADAQIKYEGKGPLARKQKGGFLFKMIDWLF